jgi:FAD:protein FMN transferase
MQIFDFDTIGTHLRVHIDTISSQDEIFSTIRERLVSFEEKYSRFLEGNWLHILNRERRWILDEDGKKMLECMLDISRNTQGYFDPTVGKRLTELGYWDPRLQILDSRKRQGIGDYRDIEIEWEEVILHGDIMLEFGGVGKGYLIDVIREIITNYQLPITSNRYLIDFGWDLYGAWWWKVGLESPFASDEAIGTLSLDDSFLACSAGTKRKWWDEYHHLIDPHTGESAREVVASYIEWHSWIITDSYGTALCVMPWVLACETLEKTPEIFGVIVRYDGAIFQKVGSRAEIFS